MTTTMAISFPGGVAVDASVNGHTVHTDQPRPLGENSAMSPFDLFLASAGTCMGSYALRFCQERGIGTEGLGLNLEAVRDPVSNRVTLVRIGVQLPDDFPEKYESSILRAVDHCSVKRHLTEPPRFELAIESMTAA